MMIEAVLPLLEGVKRTGGGWRARCPAHDDKTPSLSISLRDGKILVYCHAGCSQEAVLSALKIKPRELLGNYNAKPQIVAEYDYCDETGTLLYQKVRYEPKTFRQRRRNDRGEWTWNLSGVRRVLYRLGVVLASENVLIVEGEKDADTANARLDWCATTGGSADEKWLDEYTEVLTGKNCVVIADADVPGRSKALKIVHALAGKAASVRLLEMPRAKDLTEWVEKGGCREGLSDLIRAAGEWKPEAIDAALLLEQITVYTRRFVALSEAQARVVAVWVVHTHAIAAADATPYLAITSAEKQSGKTRLLEVLNTLIANPWFTGKVSAAVLTRKVDANRPSLLLDESDAAFGGEKEYAEALRGILNTGHRRGGTASCCIGQGANIGFKDFSTFCPKAIAGIGRLPDTVADRAIPIRLKRAAQNEKVERFRFRDVDIEAARLKAQIEAWGNGIIPRLRDARPQLPEELTDRQQDGAEPLLAIADVADGDWPGVVRQSLISLCADARASDGSSGVRLLNDIRQIFDARTVDRIASADLAAALARIETSPWSEWSNGKPISASKVARLLGPYEISPHSVRIGLRTPKGYVAEDFKDAWARYLRHLIVAPLNPSGESATGATALISDDVLQKQKATTGTSVASKNSQEQASNEPSGGVALPLEENEKVRVVEVEV